MNKLHPYFGQIVTNDELGEIFNTLASALEQFIVDFGFSGVASGGSVGQNSTPNLSVTVVGPTVAYDQSANRILIPSVNVPLQLDENNLPTGVVTAGNEKWLSVFAKFVSTPTDPRTDETSQQIYYRDVSGYQMRVAQASEAAIGTAPKPALRGDQVLLADIRLVISQASVLNADISIARAQTLYTLTGAPASVTANNLKSALQQILNAVNAVTPDTLNVAAISGSPQSLTAGTITQVITQFLGAFNVLKSYVNALPSAAGAAKLADTQTFTGQNTFNGQSIFAQTDFHDQLFITQADASRPLLSSPSVPADDSVSGNRWKHEIDFKSGTSGAGGQYWKLYVGRDGTTYGSCAMVLNASWNKNASPQRWEVRDNALDAVAIIWTYRRLIISTVPSGTNTWTDWPQDLPAGVSATMKGLLIQDSLAVGNDLNVSDDAVIGDDLHVGGDLTVDAKSNLNDVDVAGTLKLISGVVDVPGGSISMPAVDLTIDDLTADNVNGADFLYTAGHVARTSELNLAHGCPGTNRSGWKPCWIYLNGVWQAIWWEFDNQATPGITAFGSSPCPIDIPLRLPHLGIIKKIEVIHYQADAQSNDFNLVQRTTASWSSAAAPPADTLYGADSLAVSSGWKKTEIFSLLSGGVTINAGSTWFLRCWAGKTAIPNTDEPVGSTNPILGSVLSRVRLTWDDIGPKNL